MSKNRRTAWLICQAILKYVLRYQSSGGGERDRTDDLRLAKPALSQLSYTPEYLKMVGLDRFELSTSRLSGVRSNQLSYRPMSPTAGFYAIQSAGSAGEQVVIKRPYILPE